MTDRSPSELATRLLARAGELDICTSEWMTMEADAADTAALLREAASMLGREGWQPIETAPRDGTELIGLLRPKVIGLVWWFAPSSRTFGWADCNGVRVRPTHWMPLPASPKDTPEKEPT